MAGNPAVAKRMEAAGRLMRQRGLRVEAFDGWRTAGRSASFRPRAVTVHHTGAAVDVDRVLRFGRPGLPGPLDNWTLHLDGTWILTAAGRANHAGVGVLPSSESYGIECTGPVPAGNDGIDAFPMYRAYLVGVACICEVEGWTARVVYAHKETARPDCRKPDPAFGDRCPAPYRDMDRFRASVQALIGQEVEDDVTPTEYRAELVRERPQLAKAIADQLRPVLAETGPAAGVFVRKGDEPHVFAVVAGQLVQLPNRGVFAELTGGADISATVISLPANAPIWQLPTNRIPG